MVYFIREEKGFLVKIGYTKNIKQRMHQIKVGCPSEIILLGHVDGGEKEEKSIHEIFRHLRKHGEWFEYDYSMLYLIETFGTLLHGKDMLERDRKLEKINTTFYI